jgi:endonuclease G
MHQLRLGILLLTLALSACGPKRVDMEREAARTAKKLDRETAKAKQAGASNWGHFSGPIETRWEDDGITMVLLNELRYTDPYGEVWIAPAGAHVNGASIPRAFWGVIGGPFEGKYRNASVLHDVAYSEQSRSWEDADRMFYNAMRCSGVGVVTAKTMYYALRRHGRHWKHRQALPVDSGAPRPSAVSPDEVGQIQQWIRANDPNLEQIETRAAAPRP